jgi:hypothetical protein
MDLYTVSIPDWWMGAMAVSTLIAQTVIAAEYA